MKGSDERLLRLLQEARQALESERKRRTEPLALVGIGCRFPGGVTSPEQFWELLTTGTDASGDVPPDRWDADALFDADPRVPGKSYVKRGSFLSRIDGFEPEFFGISPREALALDPQQRLLLEVTWEALEDAGIVPSSLKGSATGVWIGLSIEDYARRGVPTGQLERIDAYTALGNTRSVAAGRIAYVLGVHGPVIQLDTACSSSLVAVHLAAQSLRAGECDVAIVGGVSLMSSPEATVALCKLQALSPDGRCKTFDASADGYGRGEGCGVVVLKRLSDAITSGDRVHAVVRGSAINHDGHSNGLTAPNGVAQEAVIRTALANAALDPTTVAYVEAHGTGTLLGDPIEVLALGRVYAPARSPERPLHVGSVKTNLGHLEAAAGVAALIKTALCLSHGELVPHLHVRDPNPKIPWRDLPVRVTTEGTAFPAYGDTRVAAVSAFGISGTNAHVLLTQPEPQAPAALVGARSAELVVLSARTEPALRQAAARLRKHLDAHPELELADVAHSLVITRASLDRRFCLAVSTRGELCEALDALVATPPANEPAASGLTEGKLAFVFSGQGSQWLRMGQGLLGEEPAFRSAMEECDRAVLAETGWSVLHELTAEPERSRLGRVDVVQPVLFALGVALAKLWRSWGVEPDVVVGHSMGEVAAACVAEALTLEDGAAIVCRRSSLLARISGQGEMALVELSVNEASAALRGLEDRLSVAVSNSKRSTVISGEPRALAELLAKLERDGVFCRRVKVDVASHSPQVDPLREELARRLASIAPRAPRIPMHSTVTDSLVSGEALDAAYWVDNLRQPVRFAQAIDSLASRGFKFFLEVSPHPLLCAAIDETCRESGKTVVAAGSLRRDQPERLSLLDSLGVLHAHGRALDSGRFPGGGRRVALPTYAWQRERYWIDAALPARPGRATAHPLLGVRIAVAGLDAVYETVLSRSEPAWLGAHRIAGRVLVPGAALVELLRAAAADYTGLREVISALVRRPLILEEGRGRRVQVVLVENGRRASVHSQAMDADADAGWTVHATAELGPGPLREPPDRFDLEAARSRCSEALPIETAHERLKSLGLEHGAAFHGLKRLWRGSGEALGEIELAGDLRADGYGIHPALLEAAIQALVFLFDAQPGQPLVPVELGRFVLYRTGATSLLVHARLREAQPPDGMLADLTLLDASGAVVGVVQGLFARPVDPAALAALDREGRDDTFYSTEDAPRASAAPAFVDELLELSSEDRRAKLIELVRAEVARVLSISNALSVPLARPLKELGLDSLMALELRNALSRRTGVKPSATVALMHPTVDAIAAHLLEGVTRAGDGAPSWNSTSADDASARVEADAVLDPGVRPESTCLPALAAENVLLTGATGFLGAFLVRDLIERTGARVHCIVRAKNPAEGAQRVVQNLREYGLWQEAFASRLAIHTGDLCAPRLGLEAAVFDRLGEEVDAIYNNGAQLSFVGTYGDLRASHANGTVEILRLASRGRAKAVHHVSSTAVYHSSRYSGRRVAESERAIDGQGLRLGYAQCKWVSENLVWQAAERGLVVTVHRPSFVAGSSADGAWNEADFLCRMTRAVIQMGCMPNDLDIEVDLSPVDYVSRAIVYLSCEPSARGSAFHLQNPRPVPIDAFSEILRSLGYSIRGTSYRDWVERIDADPDNPLQPLLPFLSYRWPPEELTSVELWQRAHSPRPTCDQTMAHLRSSGIECPPLDAQLIRRYVEALHAKGLVAIAPRRP